MIGGLVKKFFIKKTDENDKESKKGLAVALREKSLELSDALNEKIETAKNELYNMKDKYDNLLETNYNLGLKHIDNGNLSEAIFRFRFIKKFWPEYYDAYYQLAYCLVLNRKSVEAKVILEELEKKNPNHPQGRELSQLIDSDLFLPQNATTQDSSN